MGLRECAENDIEILGCNIVYDKYLYRCDYVKATLKGEIVYHSNSMNFF